MSTQDVDWTFVQVDPTAPKKRRKRRKLSPRPVSAVPEPVVDPPAAITPRPVDQSHSSPPEDYELPQHDSFGDAGSPYRPQVGSTTETSLSLGGMNDFERFILLSDAQDAQADGEKMNWTELFGENLFAPWTPMATTPVESALFDFYAMETVKASVSFDDESNPFREALLPLAVSDPSTFHAALAVAGAHWANRLRLSDRCSNERTLKQVRLLNLASAYHRSIAQDIVKQPLSDNMIPAFRQAAEESRVATKILNMTWQTFSDGFIVRGKLLRDVHRVIRPSAAGAGVVGAMGRFLRIWLSWVDTLDSAAHDRARSTWDTSLDAGEQKKLNHALQRTVGCTPETLQLIARTSALSAPSIFLELEAVKHNAVLAADLEADIHENMSQRIEGDEASTATRAFSLALHLYFLTSVHHSTLDHPSVVWGVQQLLNLIAHAEAHRHRQAWATWPYFILGLHATSTRHRRRVLDRFAWLATTLSVGNLSTLRTCLELLWERRDKGETTSWQEISVSLGGAVVTPL